MIHEYDPAKDYTDFTGAIRGMPEHLYFATDRLSQSAIKQWAIGIEDGLAGSNFDGAKSTAAAMGSAVHCQLLDGMVEFGKRYITGGPVNERTGNIYGRDTKAFQSWMDEQEDGAVFVTDSEMFAINKMCESVRRDEFANDLVSMPGSETELTLFWFETIGGQTIPCKARIDWFNPTIGVVDLKTTNDVSYDGFARSLIKFGWYTQSWWYQRGLEKVGISPDDMSWGWLVIQSAKPYKIKLYHPSADIVASGMVTALDGMRNYAKVLAGCPPFEQLNGFASIDIPKWGKANEFEITQAEEALR